ncbi:MAG: LacI family DNA-binding transcriptional regulator [Beutenbergiaceae bacterium]
MPTSKDVARVAGVSQSTVSYVMSGKRPISEKTRQAVFDAIAELTYEPNAGARALASRRTNVLGLVMPFENHAQAAGLMAFAEEIAQAARQRDHDILLMTNDEGPAGLKRVARRAMCDGLIAMQVVADDPRATVARDLDMPVIFIGAPEDHTGLHCIDFDFEAAAELLVTELCDAGNTRILAVGWGSDELERLAFIARFCERAEEVAAQRGVPLEWVSTERSQQDADKFVGQHLTAGSYADTGLLVCRSPVELSLSLTRAGIVPGRDLDLVALCTDLEAELQHVPATAVSTQPRDVSRGAIAWLFDCLNGDSPPEFRRIPAKLMRRRSVRGGN